MNPNPPANNIPSLFGIPLNRIVAFLGPHIAWVAGVIATWLTVHVHFLATFHVGQSDIASAIAQGAVFVVVTAVTYAGQHKWLDGFQKWAYPASGAALALPPGVDPEGPYDPSEFGPVDTDSPTVPPGVGGV